MTSSQYNNIIQGTLGTLPASKSKDSVQVARAIMDNCGVALPTGNCTDILRTLISGYMGWKSCTKSEAQGYANAGIAAIGIDTNHVLVVSPKEDTIEVASAMEVPEDASVYARTASEISADEQMTLQYFAYAGEDTTTIYPIIPENPEVPGGPGGPETPSVPQTELSCPLKSYYSISQGFTDGGHTGIDYIADNGTNILAAADGRVIYIQDWDSGDGIHSWASMGICVYIQHSTGMTVYMHMNEYPSEFITLGCYVKRGDVIGRVGSTGESTGDLLHFEYKKGTNFIFNDPNAYNQGTWVDPVLYM